MPSKKQYQNMRETLLKEKVLNKYDPVYLNIICDRIGHDNMTCSRVEKTKNNEKFPGPCILVLTHPSYKA